MNLLEKFDTIDIQLDQQIPQEDKDYLLAEQNAFDKARAQLLRSEKMFRRLRDMQPNEYITLYEKDNADDPYENKGIYPFISKGSTDKTTEEFYAILEYGWAYAIRDCIRLIGKLKEGFIKRIIDYFTKKYSLEIPDTVEEYCMQLHIGPLSWRDILEMIKSAMGGMLDFKGGAVEQAIKEFRELFRYGKRPERKGAIIEIERFCWWNNRQTSHEFSNWGSDRDKYITLDKAISVFETEEVRANYAIAYILGQKCTFDWYPPINGEKIEGLKWFKNGKLQIKFREQNYAVQFFNRFELASLQ